MNKIILGLMMFCPLYAWSLPWLQLSPSKERNNHLVEKNIIFSQTGALNFSGDWKGECNNQPVVDLSINHQPDTITLSYGFMEEKHPIGALKSDSSSQHRVSESGNSSVVWAKDGKALIFTISKQFMNNDSQLNAFFSHVSMSMDGDNLTILGEYYESSNQIGGVKNERLNCTYHRMHAIVE